MDGGEVKKRGLWGGGKKNLAQTAKIPVSDVLAFLLVSCMFAFQRDALAQAAREGLGRRRRAAGPRKRWWGTSRGWKAAR
jgi:hypothetical protein